MAGKYINIYSIQKYRTKSKGKCQIEIKNSSVNKKKVKSDSFQVYSVQGMKYMKVVKFCLAILSLFVLLYHYGWCAIGKWLVSADWY